jgi:PAS domain S-box-containing protein
MCVGQNITERKAAEGELQRVAHDLRMLIDTANAPIFGVDAAGNVNEWNLKSASLTEYTAEEVVGQSLVSLISSEFKEPVHAALMTALQGVDIATLEFTMITKNTAR